jgi:hypothetical protein
MGQRFDLGSIGAELKTAIRSPRRSGEAASNPSGRANQFNAMAA